jgi:hypothetical protein
MSVKFPASVLSAPVALLLVTSGGGVVMPARAQVVAVTSEGARVERVEVVIVNPSPDAALNQRVSDLVRRSLGVFPSDRLYRATAEMGLARARRSGVLAATSLSLAPGAGGALIVTVEATLGRDRTAAEGRGLLLTGAARDLPVLYDRNGSYLALKFENISMLYGNKGAWYGQPGPFLAGNPLVAGRPSGARAVGWGEGFGHAGIYGIMPLSETVSIYGGISGILSWSAGRELFTDRPRSHLGFEDAYVGIVGGDTSAEGNRLVWNLTAGRKRYEIGDGFIIANTAANGSTRAALQSNPRWAADFLGLAQLRYNSTLIEAFYLDPDELQQTDARTRMTGINIETNPAAGWSLGGSYIKVLESSFRYFSPAPFEGRNGLQVFNLRGGWEQGPSSGLFIKGEAALQRNDRFDVRAQAWMGEVGYRFGDWGWRPEVSYRLAHFSGDNPLTRRFERWDPLLSGGNGEQWVQGINHFKLFQDSNLVAHRIQFRFRPFARVEIVPQFWLFRADQSANVGGNPALTYLGGKNLAYEANLTAKWFPSQNVTFQGHIAATFPGSGAKASVPGTSLQPWYSAMAFMRIAY